MVLLFETERYVFIFKNVTRIIRIKPDYISFVDGGDRKRFDGEMIGVDIVYDPERCEQIKKKNKDDPEIYDKTLWKLKRKEF